MKIEFKIKKKLLFDTWWICGNKRIITKYNDYKHPAITLNGTPFDYKKWRFPERL